MWGIIHKQSGQWTLFCSALTHRKHAFFHSSTPLYLLNLAVFCGDARWTMSPFKGASISIPSFYTCDIRSVWTYVNISSMVLVEFINGKVIQDTDNKTKDSTYITKKSVDIRIQCPGCIRSRRISCCERWGGGWYRWWNCLSWLMKAQVYL